jgi:hypothetical protein
MRCVCRYRPPPYLFVFLFPYYKHIANTKQFPYPPQSGLSCCLPDKAHDIYKEILIKYIQENLVPTLHEGDSVVMDTLSVHKAAKVEDFLNPLHVSVLHLAPLDLENIDRV